MVDNCYKNKGFSKICKKNQFSECTHVSIEIDYKLYKLKMAAIFDSCLFCFCFYLYCVNTEANTQLSNNTSMQYCSFFENRAPTAQPGLKNCTWFKDNSCCMQQEIAATFGKVKPLKGASVECQKYINYLMCYICAPYQNLFYQWERMTVCESFCDSLYAKCKDAILKGSIISQLYDNGTDFCESRSFLVNTTGCFDFDASLDKRDTGLSLTSNWTLILILLLVIFYVRLPDNYDGYIVADEVCLNCRNKCKCSFHQKFGSRWSDKDKISSTELLLTTTSITTTTALQFNL